MQKEMRNSFQTTGNWIVNIETFIYKRNKILAGIIEEKREEKIETGNHIRKVD